MFCGVFHFCFPRLSRFPCILLQVPDDKRIQTSVRGSMDYTLRRVVDNYVSSGSTQSTVNICALDLRKAFDKMNHCGLFVKLMKKLVPRNLLLLLEVRTLVR